MFCSVCDNEVSQRGMLCVKCGAPTGWEAVISTPAKSRVAYRLLGFFLGGLGVHNFYAGYVRRGIAQLLISLATCWLFLPLIGVWIWALIEIFTVKKDAQRIPMR
jgi:TM2 domain-containing membrane protein YozV